jgi:NAD(P)-dependent dehydrogenase (short-subunit alcohol dehydrogenase family)
MDDNRSDFCHTNDSTGSAYSTGWLYDRQVCLANKIALVTGAASGIGKAVVTELVQRKAFVFAADIDGDRVRDLASQLNNTTALTLDVTEESAWQSAFQSIRHLDIFISAAGVSHAKPTTDMSLEEWRRVMAVNLDGAFLGVRSALRAMIPKKNGSMVLIASASGIKASAGASAYCASKAGLRMLAKAVALECKDHGIRVNSVSPAAVATPMWTTMPFWVDLVAKYGGEEGAWKALGGISPDQPSLQRMAFPEEIAHAVLFLASDESSHITGTDLVVDAGYTA